MTLVSKCNFLKIISWVFFSAVIIQSLYVGIKFNCWLGLVAAIVGFSGGFSYARFRKNKCSSV